MLVDPKPGNMHAYSGVTLLTPNAKETGESVHMPVDSPENVILAGKAMMQRLSCSHLITTLGADGMASFSKSGQHPAHSHHGAAGL